MLNQREVSSHSRHGKDNGADNVLRGDNVSVWVAVFYAFGCEAAFAAALVIFFYPNDAMGDSNVRVPEKGDVIADVDVLRWDASGNDDTAPWDFALHTACKYREVAKSEDVARAVVIVHYKEDGQHCADY